MGHEIRGNTTIREPRAWNAYQLPASTPAQASLSKINHIHPTSHDRQQHTYRQTNTWQKPLLPSLSGAPFVAGCCTTKAACCVHRQAPPLPANHTPRHVLQCSSTKVHGPILSRSSVTECVPNLRSLSLCMSVHMNMYSRIVLTFSLS